MFEINNFVTAGKFFLIIAGELVLIFVAVSFLVGILMEYLPPSRIRDFLSNKLMWVQYLLGSGLGAVTPFCSCSTVPITAGLLKGGVPFGPTMSFSFRFTGSKPYHYRPAALALWTQSHGCLRGCHVSGLHGVGSPPLENGHGKSGQAVNEFSDCLMLRRESKGSCEDPACCCSLLCVRDRSAPYYVSHLSDIGRMLCLGSKSCPPAIN